MQYLKMLPYQVRKAIEDNVPVVLPVGVVEYHAEHLPLGVDSFVCMNAVERVEKRHPEIVVLPPFLYGCASYAVAAPEGNGSLQVDCLHLIPMAEDLFQSLLRVGFRNIHLFIAHQGEEFEQGMPTDLAFRTAARHTIFNWLEKHQGEGWWGTEKYADYYGGNNPFAWIQFHPFRRIPAKDCPYKFVGDHAGLCETSETMAMFPELVELDRIDGTLWYAREGLKASAEYGEAALEAASRGIEKALGFEIE